MAKITNLNVSISKEDLRQRVAQFEPMKTYSFTRQKNPQEFSHLEGFLPPGYINAQNGKLQVIDFIYSGSSHQPFILGFMAGRLDTTKGNEMLDYDFFHISPQSGSVDDYFMKQFHHIKDDAGNRITQHLGTGTLSPLSASTSRLYTTYLTGSTTSSTFEEYEKDKPLFMDYFRKSF